MATASTSHNATFVKVWIGLLGLTLIEVILGYIQFNMHIMLTLLMGFSIVKAYLIMAYFMHLKYDRPSLSWILVPPLVACILIMVGYFFPDSFHLLAWKP
jgi:cytochrome c oxidase subunit 4